MMGDNKIAVDKLIKVCELFNQLRKNNPKNETYTNEMIYWLN